MKPQKHFRFFLAATAFALFALVGCSTDAVETSTLIEITMADSQEKVVAEVLGADDDVIDFTQYLEESIPSILDQSADIAEVSLRRGNAPVFRYAAPDHKVEEGRDAPGLAALTSMVNFYVSRKAVTVTGLAEMNLKATTCTTSCAVWDRCFLGRYPIEAVEGYRTTCSNGSVIYTEFGSAGQEMLCQGEASLDMGCVE